MDIDLLNQYQIDLDRFKRRGKGLPINIRAWAEPLVPMALSIAAELFHGAKIEEAPDGSVLVALEKNIILALICLPDQHNQNQLDAFAARDGRTYFIGIRLSLIRLLFNLSLGIWKNRQFLSDISPFIKNSEFLQADLIPLGFEEYFLRNNVRRSDHPELLEGDSKIDLTRHELHFCCFKQGLSFFWLHEIAHVLGGHLDLMDDIRRSKSDETSKHLGIIDEFENTSMLNVGTEEQQIELPQHAFEIEADRWALDRIFGAFHHKNSYQAADDLGLIATVIGCTLFPISLHGHNVLQNKYDHAKSHPPLWFRADDVLTAEDKAARDRWFALRRGDQDFELFRFRQKNLVQCGLASLSRLHPMFGDWLNPVAESSRQAEGQRVLNAARAMYASYYDILSTYRRSVKLLAEDNDYLC